MLTFVASIFVFGLLIMAHEVGHFIAARWCGIKVLELAIGFGPRLVGWERKGTRYSLRLIPLGGFCRMLGEDPEEAGDPDAFPRKSIAQRALVLLSGSLMNLVLALLVFFVVFFFLTGVPSDSSRIRSVIPGSAAEEAGLQAGDGDRQDRRGAHGQLERCGGPYRPRPTRRWACHPAPGR